jgi:hypothetical protein
MPLIEEGLENHRLIPANAWVSMLNALSRAPLTPQLSDALAGLQGIEFVSSAPGSFLLAQKVTDQTIIPLLTVLGVKSRILPTLKEGIPIAGFVPLEVDDGPYPPSLLLVFPGGQDFDRAGESAGLPLLPPAMLATLVSAKSGYHSAILSDGARLRLLLPTLDPFAYGDIEMDLRLLVRRGLASELVSALGVFFPRRFGGAEGWKGAFRAMEEMRSKWEGAKINPSVLRGYFEQAFHQKQVFPPDSFWDDLGLPERGELGDLPGEIPPFPSALAGSGEGEEEVFSLAKKIDRMVGEREYEEILTRVRVLLWGDISAASLAGALLGLCLACGRAFSWGRVSAERSPFTAGELCRHLTTNSLLAVVEGEQRAALLRSYLALLSIDRGGEPPLLAHRVIALRRVPPAPNFKRKPGDDRVEERHLLAGGLEALTRQINKWSYQRLSRIYREQVIPRRRRLMEGDKEIELADLAPDFLAIGSSATKFKWERIKPGVWVGI